MYPHALTDFLETNKIQKIQGIEKTEILFYLFHSLLLSLPFFLLNVIIFIEMVNAVCTTMLLLCTFCIF